MAKKYQIFISSTFKDLVEERQDTIKTILDLEQIPSGMEVFPAADQEQFEYIKKVIDECDYYVLIIGARYGSVDAEGVSYTEREYDYAVSSGKTVLAFIHNETESLPVSKVDTDQKLAERLGAFRAKVQSGRLVKFWNSRENLQSAFVMSLVKAMTNSPAIGWIRGNAAVSEDLLEQINAVRNENDRLKQALAEANRVKTRIQNHADIEDKFRIRYKRKGHFVGNQYIDKGEVTLTWKEIYRAVAPAFMRPSVPGNIKWRLAGYLKENYNLAPPEFEVLNTDSDTIKLHFTSLGWFDVKAATTTTGGVDEFVSLTPEGKQALLDLSAVARSSGE